MGRHDMRIDSQIHESESQFGPITTYYSPALFQLLRESARDSVLRHRGCCGCGCRGRERWRARGDCGDDGGVGVAPRREADHARRPLHRLAIPLLPRLETGVYH